MIDSMLLFQHCKLDFVKLYSKVVKCILFITLIVPHQGLVAFLLLLDYFCVQSFLGVFILVVVVVVVVVC